MNSEVLSYVTEKTNELISAASCCQELKDAAGSWLTAVGTEREAEETKKYLAELEADIVTVDGLIAFAGSEQGISHFGAQMAENIAAHAREIKAAGAVYCDCPACAAVAAILDKKDLMLA